MTLEIRPDSGLEQPPEPWRDRARQHLVTSRIAVVAVTRRRAWETWRVTRQLPDALRLLVCYSPRGFGRVCVMLWRYLRDEASDELRQHAAREHDAAAAEKAVKVRQVTLRARLLTASALVTLSVTLLLAWFAPDVLAVLVGVGVLGVMIRVLPWRAWQEVPVALSVSGAAWWATGRYAPLLPCPPAWALWLGGVTTVLWCGWVGRPARPLVTLPHAVQGDRVSPLTAPMVMAALVALGNSKMKDPDSIRLLTDPHRYGQGYQVDLELPGAVTATWVIDQREQLAAAMRRELGCVWPSVGPRHPGHLALFVSDVAMSRARQAPWPLLAGRPTNLFEAVALFTNQRGEWVSQVLAYTAWVIGAVPRMGKTMALRIMGIVAALDVRAKLYVFDLKGTGDLSALARVCAASGGAYGIGDEPEEIAEQLARMREVREEMRRRTRLVRVMSLDENPEQGKVTDALATRDPQNFGPIVILVDECQVWFEEFDEALVDEEKSGKEVREEFIRIMRDLVKRGPALGIIPVLATQKPDAKSIPSSIAANASARLCLKVNGQVSNDQILGTSMYQTGIRATQFAFSEKGVAYFIGDGADPLIVRTVFGVDAARAEELADRALALRTAAGLLHDDVIDAEVVPTLDVPADCARVMVRHGSEAAHLATLVDWLAELRSTDYGVMDADELGKRLRNEGVRVLRQLKVGGVNTSGVRLVDLRKHLDGDDDETVGGDA